MDDRNTLERAGRRLDCEIVLNALEVGKEVTLSGRIVLMQDKTLYTPVKKFTFATKEWEEILTPLKTSVSWFIKECEKLSEKKD